MATDEMRTADEEDDGPTLARRIKAIRATRNPAKRSASAAFASASVVDFCDGGCPSPGDPDDLVIRKGLIFKVGSYADVAFSMTRDELARAKRLFRPVPIRLEHKASVLDGKLGTLRSVELSADGTELHGEAALPRWLANLVPAGMPLKVSASWDRATKLLAELSLVLAPRIEGAALAAFSHTAPHPRAASMSEETPVEYARRVNRTHLGPPSLSDNARRFMEATPRGRAALAAREPAAFSAAATAPAPPSIQYQYIQTPAEPTAEEDAAFLAKLGTVAEVAAASLRASIANVEGQARRAPHANLLIWTHATAGHVAHAERLRAMLAAVESGTPYRAPSPAAVLEVQGRAIVELALSGGKTSPADLVAAVGSRLNFARPKAAEASAAVESQLRAFGHHGGDVDALRGPLVRAMRESSALDLEVAALEKTAGAIGPAMGAEVARAVEAAGGADQVSSDLADVLLISATPPGPDADGEELSATLGQLKAIGPDARGRAADVLRSRRDELTATVEARRTGARDLARAEASSIVESALEGRMAAWRKLLDAVQSHADAFAESFGPDLEGAPLAAFSAAGFAGCASVIL